LRLIDGNTRAVVLGSNNAVKAINELYLNYAVLDFEEAMSCFTITRAEMREDICGEKKSKLNEL
jgi:hypothetical protein